MGIILIWSFETDKNPTGCTDTPAPLPPVNGCLHSEVLLLASSSIILLIIKSTQPEKNPNPTFDIGNIAVPFRVYGSPITVIQSIISLMFSRVVFIKLDRLFKGTLLFYFLIISCSNNISNFASIIQRIKFQDICTKTGIIQYDQYLILHILFIIVRKLIKKY